MYEELTTKSPDASDVMSLQRETKEETCQQIKHLKNELEKSVEVCHAKVDELPKIVTRQSDELFNCNSKIEIIQLENVKLMKTVKDLELRLSDVEQYSRMNMLEEMSKLVKLKKIVNDLEVRLSNVEEYSRMYMLEINGIYEEANENVLKVVKKVGEKLGIIIQDDMVDVCHRVGPKNKDRVRGIIIKFTRRSVKEELLAARKMRRDFSTKDIGETNKPVRTIFVNESLSAEKRRIFNAVRIVRREMGIQFLWIRDGKILLRAKEGAKVIEINSMDQVRQSYIRRRLMTTYKALERLSQSEFNLDRLEVAAAAATAGVSQAATALQPEAAPCPAGGAGLVHLQVPGKAKSTKQPAAAAATLLRVVASASATANLPLTVNDVERERGKPLSKYDRNMMIFNWLHTLDSNSLEGGAQ